MEVEVGVTRLQVKECPELPANTGSWKRQERFLPKLLEGAWPDNDGKPPQLSVLASGIPDAEL